jgi:hypothetical protein
VGTSLTIAGSNFGAAQGTSTVTFNGTLATPTSWSATSITVPVPLATTGNVVVTVGGVPSNGMPFSMTAVSGNACDIDGNGVVNVSDVQLMINEASGISPPLNDLNHDGAITVADVQIVINAALGLGCRV